MFWQLATRAPDIAFADTHLGRYLIRCAYKGAPYHRLFFNGKWTGYRGSVDELKRTVDCIIAGQIIAELAKS
jgi:hypothetical protein